MFKHKRTLHLEAQDRQRLQQMRNRDPKPYLRERAAALLLVAQGHAPYEVAHHKLLKTRKSDTVYRWLNRYEQKGLAGLCQLPRSSQRGFSPSRG